MKKILLTIWDDNICEKLEFDSFNDVNNVDFENKKVWIHLTSSIKNEESQKFFNKFNIHSLSVEDFYTESQRPKIDFFSDYIFIHFKNIRLVKSSLIVKRNSVNIIFGNNFLISFSEKEIDFKDINSRFNDIKSRLRKNKTDYLAYAILDLVVDDYFNEVEKFGEFIDNLEDDFAGRATQETLQNTYKFKRQLISFRKHALPLREVVYKLQKNDSSLVDVKTELFFRDIFDHIIQIIENLDTYREITSSMVEMYLSFETNKSNQIMKILTIMSSIFIPLTFIVGVYGMNFEFMPELDWKYGYLYVWALMVGLTSLLILVFKNKKWF